MHFFKNYFLLSIPYLCDYFSLFHNNKDVQKLDWCKNPENKHGNNNTNVMIVDAIIVMNYKVKIVLMTYNNMIVKKNILLTILLC